MDLGGDLMSSSMTEAQIQDISGDPDALLNNTADSAGGMTPLPTLAERESEAEQKNDAAPANEQKAVSEVDESDIL